MSKAGDKKMINRIFYLCCFLMCAKAFDVAIITSVSADYSSDIQQCINTRSRIERLSCFDRVFNVGLQQEGLTEPEKYPHSWLKAMKGIETEGGNLVLLTEGEGRGSKAWIILPALNQETQFSNNAKPILMFSCIDNLSRIEIALPSSVQDARVKVSLSNHVSQVWRSDDSGLLMSSARGLPAINMMKEIMHERRLLIRSNAPFIDGLQFNTEELSGSINALRQRCGW